MLGITLCEGDVTDRESMRPHMAGADGVFHIAGCFKVGVRDKRPGQVINVEGTRNVLSLMADLAIPKGVYTSTLAVFSDTHGRLVDKTYRFTGTFLSEYDRTKWVAHYEVAEPMMARGLPLVIVQPGAVMLRVMAGVTYLGSSAKAQRELGFSARSLEDGLQETLRYEMELLGASPREPKTRSSS